MFLGLKLILLSGMIKRDDNVNMFLGLDSLKKMNQNDKITIEFKSEEIEKKTDDGRYIKVYNQPKTYELKVSEFD